MFTASPLGSEICGAALGEQLCQLFLPLFFPLFGWGASSAAPHLKENLTNLSNVWLWGNFCWVVQFHWFRHFASSQVHVIRDYLTQLQIPKNTPAGADRYVWMPGCCGFVCRRIKLQCVCVCAERERRRQRPSCPLFGFGIRLCQRWLLTVLHPCVKLLRSPSGILLGILHLHCAADLNHKHWWIFAWFTSERLLLHSVCFPSSWPRVVRFIIHPGPRIDIIFLCKSLLVL